MANVTGTRFGDEHCSLKYGPASYGKLVAVCAVSGSYSLQFARAFGTDLEQLRKLTRAQIAQVGFGLESAFVKGCLVQEVIQGNPAAPLGKQHLYPGFRTLDPSNSRVFKGTVIWMWMPHSPLHPFPLPLPTPASRQTAYQQPATRPNRG